MNEQVSRFIDLYEKSGILRPVFLCAFFNWITFEKPQSFSAVLACAEKAFRETDDNETGKAIRKLELVK